MTIIILGWGLSPLLKEGRKELSKQASKQELANKQTHLDFQQINATMRSEVRAPSHVYGTSSPEEGDAECGRLFPYLWWQAFLFDAGTILEQRDDLGDFANGESPPPGQGREGIFTGFLWSRLMEIAGSFRREAKAPCSKGCRSMVRLNTDQLFFFRCLTAAVEAPSVPECILFLLGSFLFEWNKIVCWSSWSLVYCSGRGDWFNLTRGAFVRCTFASAHRCNAPSWSKHGPQWHFHSNLCRMGLKNPKKTYRETIKVVLVAAHFLSIAKQCPDASKGAVWRYVRKECR